MTLSTTANPAFQCAYTRAAPDAECYRHRIPAGELEGIVLGKIRENTCELPRTQSVDDHDDVVENESVHLKKHPNRPTSMEDGLRALYERFALGEITVEAYKTAREAYDAGGMVKAVEEAHTDISHEAEAFFDMASDIHNATELTRDITNALIEKVMVFPNQKVEVHFFPIHMER
jgi:hypothetical protein